MNEIERNNRINQEFERINVFFEELNEDEKAIISPLIQNASFMRVTLEDLQEIISDQGPVEQYQNGANQYGMKQSAALQSYNALVKNYAAVIKSLFGLLPPEKVRKEFPVWKPKEETEEEEAERQRKREEELDAAVEYQKRQRELEELLNQASSSKEREQIRNELQKLRFR